MHLAHNPISFASILKATSFALITIAGSMANMYATEPQRDADSSPVLHASTNDPMHMAARYATYNQWANEAMAAWLAAASDEQMRMELESSFNSLRSTALHIWSAEYLWLQVLKNEPYDDNPTRNFEGSNAALLEGWLNASAQFQAYAASLSPEELAGSRGGNDGPLLVSDIIQHCMNHSTYHRGQLITLGRQAGLQEPPRTDFIFFANTAGK